VQPNPAPVKRSYEDAFESRDDSPNDTLPGNVFGAVALFEGSPTYKQRKKQGSPVAKRSAKATTPLELESDTWEAETTTNVPSDAAISATFFRSTSSPAAYTTALRSPSFSSHMPAISATANRPNSSHPGLRRQFYVDSLPPSNMYTQTSWG
jgi:hypothetical protein